MDALATIFVNATIGAIALFILWQFQQAYFKDITRRDDLLRLERETNQSNHKEFMLMLAGLMGKQTITDDTITKTSVSTGVQIEGARGSIEQRITSAQEALQDALNIIRSEQIVQSAGIERIEKNQTEDKSE